MDVAGGVGGDPSVTLVIKAPSQRQDDQVIDCLLSWTVRKLKEHLETVYPSKPKSHEQRLIYSGKLLQDEKTLKDVLRQYDGGVATDNRYTLHLVCASIDSTSAPKSGSSSATAEKSKKSNSTTTSTTSSSSSAARTQAPPNSNVSSANTAYAAAGSDGLRYRGSLPHMAAGMPPVSAGLPQTAYPGMAGYSYTSGMAPGYSPYMSDTTAYGTGFQQGFSFSPEQAQAYGYTQEQYAMAMQQMYSQYMMQYMQYYQQAYQTPPSPGFIQHPANPWPQPANVAAPPADVHNAGGDPAPINPPAPAAAAPRQNMRMNAQGGMEEEDEEARDWLHHVYFVMRFLTFLGILFFYSNVTRFLIVLAGSFAIYFAQKFRRYIKDRRERHQAQQENEVNQQEQEAQDESTRGEAQDEDPDGSGEDAANENIATDGEEAPPPDQPAVAVEEERVAGRLTRGLMFAINTVQTFFTSLIPAPPELLEAN